MDRSNEIARIYGIDAATRNRLNIAFRAPAGTYQPAPKARTASSRQPT